MSTESPVTSSPRSRAARVSLRLLKSVAFIYLTILLVMTVLERWLVYPAPPATAGEWNPPHLEYEDVHFASGDGTPLHGWYFDNPNAERSLLFFHGNGEHVAYAADMMPLIGKKLSASVFLFDYRGYGRSEGKPHEAGLIADGVAASEWLTERSGVLANQQILMGRSIGGGVAVAVAERQGAGCLVLQSTFTRLTDPAAKHYPWLPVRLLMKNRYPSIERIAAYNGPVFSCHGTHDTLIPLEMGQALFEAAPTNQKRFLPIEGRGHNDPPDQTYWDELAQFLDEVLPPSPE